MKCQTADDGRGTRVITPDDSNNSDVLWILLLHFCSNYRIGHPHLRRATDRKTRVRHRQSLSRKQQQAAQATLRGHHSRHHCFYQNPVVLLLLLWLLLTPKGGKPAKLVMMKEVVEAASCGTCVAQRPALFLHGVRGRLQTTALFLGYAEQKYL